METVARWMLGTGKIHLTGHTPNGHVFYHGSAVGLVEIAQCRAVIRGVDADEPAPLPTQAALGDFRVPQRGLFAITGAVLQGSGMEERPLTSGGSAHLAA
jgi:hypothetical protein